MLFFQSPELPASKKHKESIAIIPEKKGVTWLLLLHCAQIPLTIMTSNMVGCCLDDYILFHTQKIIESLLSHKKIVSLK